MPLYSTGSNSHGQTSQSNLEDSSNFTLCQFSNSNSNLRILDLKFGGTHTLALTCEGEERGGYKKKEVYVSGCNAKGQLGLKALDDLENKNNNENNNNYTSFQLLSLELILLYLDLKSDQLSSGYSIEAIASSWDTSFVLFSNPKPNQSDILTSFGGNDWGELGVGVKGHSLTTPTSGKIHQIDLKHLLLEGREKESYFKIKKLCAGPRHIIILVRIYSASRSEGECVVVGWGVARHGQLGQTKEKIILSPRILLIPTLPPTSSILDIKIGRDHSIIFYRTTPTFPTLFTFLGQMKGGIKSPTLPTFSSNQSIISIESSWSSLYFLSRSTSSDTGFDRSTINALGSNSHSQLAHSPELLTSTSTPIEISLPLNSSSTVLKHRSGSEHNLVLILKEVDLVEGKETEEDKSSREVWAWGWNEHGNLGDGSKVDSHILKSVWKEELRGKGGKGGRIIDCWAGNATSWIYVED